MKTRRTVGASFCVVALAVSNLLGPNLVPAQESCPGCVLGIWDDPALTSDRGTIVPNQLKDLYLGVKFGGVLDSLSGIEFSIAGFAGDSELLLLRARPLGPRALVWGWPAAPADTTATSTEDGGAAIAWSQCRVGDQALVMLTVFTTSDISDHVLVVKRDYPPTNPSWVTPVFTRCDDPAFTATRIIGGCYVLNWSGEPVPCESGIDSPTAVEEIAWSSVKQLFR